MGGALRKNTLLQGSQILTGLGELALLHTLTHVPVDEGTLGVHQIELVVQAGPSLGDGGGVAQHAHGTLHLGQVTAGHHGGGLVVDAHLWTDRQRQWVSLLLDIVSGLAVKGSSSFDKQVRRKRDVD